MVLVLLFVVVLSRYRECGEGVGNGRGEVWRGALGGVGVVWCGLAVVGW